MEKYHANAGIDVAIPRYQACNQHILNFSTYKIIVYNDFIPKESRKTSATVS